VDCRLAGFEHSPPSGAMSTWAGRAAAASKLDEI